jgi:hypothetical protein
MASDGIHGFILFIIKQTGLIIIKAYFLLTTVFLIPFGSFSHNSYFNLIQFWMQTSEFFYYLLVHLAYTQNDVEENMLILTLQWRRRFKYPIYTVLYRSVPDTEAGTEGLTKKKRSVVLHLKISWRVKWRCRVAPYAFLWWGRCTPVCGEQNGLNRVRVTLQQSVSPAWCRAPSGAHDQILITVCQYWTPHLTRCPVCHLS